MKTYAVLIVMLLGSWASAAENETPSYGSSPSDRISKSVRPRLQHAAGPVDGACIYYAADGVTQKCDSPITQTQCCAQTVNKGTWYIGGTCPTPTGPGTACTN